MNPRIMNAWLQAQSQKSNITEADMQRKRLGINNKLNEKFNTKNNNLIQKPLELYNNEQLNENWKNKLGAILATTALSAGAGAGLGSLANTADDIRAGIKDNVGQVVGIEDAGNIDRARKEIRNQVLGGGTTIGAVGGGLAGAALAANAFGRTGVNPNDRRRNLSEELKNEEKYSELLENVLFKLLGEEKFTQLIEYVMQGDLVTGKDGVRLTPEQSERRKKRLQQIIDFGVNAAKEGNNFNVNRAALSAMEKGAGTRLGKEYEDTLPNTNFNAQKQILQTSLRRRAAGEEAPITFGATTDPEDPRSYINRDTANRLAIKNSEIARGERLAAERLRANTL